MKRFLLSITMMAALLAPPDLAQSEPLTLAAKLHPVTPATAPRYSITDLGTLGGPMSQGMGNNENNQVVGASQSVLEVPRGENSSQLILVVNGKTDASTEGDLSTQLLIAHVPLVLHPAAQDVLLVGLGSGITAGGALQHDIRRLDVVEISREVVEASSLFAPFNNQALRDPRLHLVVDDAKTFLRTVPRRYDVIVNQPSNPWISGIGALLTEEFFWEARNHLNPGGILVQWIQGYEFSDELFKTVLATTGACTAPPVFAGLETATTPATPGCRVDLGWSAAAPRCSGPAAYSVYRSTDPDFVPAAANRIAEGVGGTGFADLTAPSLVTVH